MNIISITQSELWITCSKLFTRNSISGESKGGGARGPGPPPPRNA